MIIPRRYKQKLLPETTEVAIKLVKDTFQALLADALNLRRVTAPLFVLSGTGLNDDLNGYERAVKFPIAHLGDRMAEVVHSLAKWKRVKLEAYDVAPGYGLYTDMNAIRADEELDNLHSLYVDQWDWEQTIDETDRNLDYLKATVEKIYNAIRLTEKAVYRNFPHITPRLPQEITFIHTEELLQRFPHLTPREREDAATRECGAVFIIGIGSVLSNGEPHDSRAPDYDDWSTPNSDGFIGLNGDILVWDSILERAVELSSMGIRVSPESLQRQLDIAGCEERAGLMFHSRLLAGELPASIGGGIGQSRLCMFLLQKAHIGEVQASIWPEEQRRECAIAGIDLL
ncbi:MAG: aspartate--ammonia ligase [Firmicutes bacterium]|nr:aspartate--ammonia ligase [Bacillota bacterium]MCM1400951.1 aspartate--ammonia ligase [Bacteroides sp.]MCM1476302.1 aspartate--ammonia ligase [Bacteroides sp.]